MTKPKAVLPYMQRGVRYIDGEFQLRCDHCAKSRQGAFYWPITLEYWDPKRGMGRCRACWVIRHRALQRERDRQNVERVRAKNNAYRQANRETINRMRRERYVAERRAKQMAQMERAA